MKTGWKQLTPFNVIGLELKQKYHAAVRVSFLNNKLHKRDNNRDRLVAKKEKKLVYLDSSPDYCAEGTRPPAPLGCWEGHAKAKMHPPKNADLLVTLVICDTKQ